jgi:triosephosphate isomerase
MRIPTIAANWKMHMSVSEATRFVETLAPKIQDLDGVEVILAAPFTALAALKTAVAGTPLQLAGQNVHPEPKGAFTGEISVSMLKDVGCRYVIVGHSERRHVFGETNEFVGRKVEEREAQRTFEVVREHLTVGLEGVDSESVNDLIIAYEPVWAIGTGKTATPEQAQEVHAFIRECLAKSFGPPAQGIRIQYGGSVKPTNVFELMDQPDVDGALVGGASLDPEAFYAIIRFDRPSGETAP